MQVLQIPSNIYNNTKYDVIESDSYYNLSAFSPGCNCFGIVLSASSLYYYNGFDWILINNNPTTSGISNVGKVNGISVSNGNSECQINWNVIYNATYYKVYVTPTSGQEYLYGLTLTNNILVSGLNNGSNYSSRVVASNNGLDGYSSDVFTLTPTSQVLPTVSNIGHSAGINNIQLYWDSVNGATSYDVYISVNGNSDILYGYSLTNSLNITGLSENTTYSIKVVAKSFSGGSSTSNYYIVTTKNNLPDQVQGLTIYQGKLNHTLVWNNAKNATSYKIYASSGTNQVAYLSASTYNYIVNSNLTSGVRYNYSITSNNATGDGLSSTTVSAIAISSTFQEKILNYQFESFSGMLANGQPNEGNIPVNGRTYKITTSPLYPVSATYVDLLFANTNYNAISGLKYRLAMSNVNPTATNNSNPNIGWISGTVNIASASSNGHTYTSARVQFNTTIYNPEISLYIFHPEYTSSNNYARSYNTNISAGTPGSVIHGLDSLYRQYKWFGGSPFFVDVNYSDGDFVSNNLALSSNHARNDISISTLLPPWAGSVPLVGLRWGVPSRSRKIIEFVGDDSVQGVNDNSETISVQGVAARLNETIGSRYTSGNYDFVNLGMTGFTPEQYLQRWKDWANNYKNDGTALLYSIYSVNGYVDQYGNALGRYRNEQLKLVCIDAEITAKQMGRVFIPCFLHGSNIMNGSTFGNYASAFSSNYTFYIKELLQWATDRYGSMLLDLSPAVNDITNTIGTSISPEYAANGYFLNTNGYNALGVYGSSIFDNCYTLAKIAAGG